MAEEFHAGICRGTWWNSTKPMLTGCSLPPSTELVDMGNLGYDTDMVDIRARTRYYEESTKNPVYGVSSTVFQGHPHHQADSDSGVTSSSLLIDSTLQMMGFGLPSSTTSDWNLSLLRSNGRTEFYNSILQEDIDSRLNHRQETGMGSAQILNYWSPKSYSGPGKDSSITVFEPIDQDISLNSVTSSGNSTPTCQGLSARFPMASSSYGYPSTLLHSLFQSDPQTSEQQSLFNNRSINYMSSAKSSWPKQQPSSLRFSNNTPFWNASATGINDVKTGFLPSPASQFLVQTFEEKANCPSSTTKTNSTEVGKSASGMKRPKLESPSPLPTFKVRKEKLGDRITALQQLVSPFGKTDTASVLHEAIEYIKFLHDQVNVLSTPYMKQAVDSIQQENIDNLKDPDEPKQDLKSRGLCLVPISSTFPVTNETTADIWTPTFGGTLR
ncbi:hypothetical protein ES319_D06G146400v1 [Gossypium barbadense]|uniref:BHLH domain-containing protein n=2 Tax=Gossypium TaxID=3633 RepID=A0A5J5R9D3_GOSBA|nr:hypothetical protein ES319_D06G146400v1 [Gossypium barbadense]TYG65081.1 hypothetical protein ES288_D06G156500v1 [Gossypium darwinii]